MICLLPASCGKAAEENAPDAEPLRIESAEKSYRAEPVEIGLAAGEEIRDIQGEGEEVLCLIGKSVGARYVRADAELSLKEESVEEERFPFAFCDVNGERYTVEIDRQDPLRTAVCVYRGEDTVCETGVPYTGGVSAQILERDGTVYAAVGDRCLVIGGKALFVPEETADGKSREIAGLMSLKTGVFLLLGEKTRQGEETVPTGSWLLPVGPDTKELSPSGMACEALFASSVCSSDGEFGYSVAGGALYKTDGEKWEKLLDLTSAGVESGPGTLRAFAALSGERFLFAYGNGLTLLSPSEEEPQQKQEIVVGILDDSMEYSLQDAVLRFNRDNTRYTVSFRSFAGNQDHLNLALLSGELALVLSEEPEIMRAYAR